MGHEKLGNWFNSNFALWKHHGWSLDVIESMIPWERSVYMDLLSEYIKEEEKRRLEVEAQMKAHQQSIQRRHR